jgi:ribonucleoside-diphosphate reductase alpha chain
MEEGRNVDHFVGSYDLTVRDHLEVQKIVQKHIDSAVSKTINMPENYTVEDMSEIWLEYLPFVKGTTFYRENTRGYVDDKGVTHEPPLVALPLETAKRQFREAVEASTFVNTTTCKDGGCEF